MVKLRKTFSNPLPIWFADSQNMPLIFYIFFSLYLKVYLLELVIEVAL